MVRGSTLYCNGGQIGHLVGGVPEHEMAVRYPDSTVIRIKSCLDWPYDHFVLAR